MSNIPRRKIYEKMLIFEDGMIEMQIMLYNQENFDKFSDAFNKNTLHKMKKSYIDIKSLMIMFLENRKYHDEEEFDEDLRNLALDQEYVNSILRKNRNLTINLKLAMGKMNSYYNKFHSVDNLMIGTKLYKTFDKFNHLIPKFLELRRDEMK